jgi:hypothetical protein
MLVVRAGTPQAKMGSKLTYVHEDGINFNRISPDLIVGSCLQTAADVDTLRQEQGVGTVLCLQEDKDMAWWNLDIQPIVSRAAGAKSASPCVDATPARV